MIVTMGVSLYTSRVILDVLGICDYGIYSVIAGIVLLISLLNNSMSGATQRFITFELGKGDSRSVSNIFSMSLTAHFCISLLVLLLGETIGLYYVYNYLNVPVDRHHAALWVYQLSLLTIVVNIIRNPYNASVIAYEKMDFFAVVSILEALLKLILVLLLSYFQYDKLIVYAILILANTAFVNLIYKLYCQKKFNTCNYYWFFERKVFNKLLSFFGWNIMGIAASAGTHQVCNIILNAFCGPVINAAYGVASQVSGSINSVAVNFETAYTPQIVKLYSQNKMSELFQLVRRSSLISYYLLFILAMPIFFNIDFILGIWLKEVPPFAAIFSKWLIAYFLIDAMQAPLWILINATGNIKTYEIWLSLILVFNMPLSYYCLNNGISPTSVVIISAILNFITAIVRTIHVKLQLNFPVLLYLTNVILRLLIVTVVYSLFYSFIEKPQSLPILFIHIFLSVIFCMFIIFTFGINKGDRKLLLGFIGEKVGIRH